MATIPGDDSLQLVLSHNGYIATSITSGVLLLIQIFILYKFVVQLRKSKEHTTKTLRFVTKIAFTTLLCSVLSRIFWLILDIFSVSECESTEQICLILQYIVSTFRSLSFILFTFFLIWRLIATFGATDQQLPLWNKIFLSVLVLSIILSAVGTYFYFVYTLITLILTFVTLIMVTLMFNNRLINLALEISNQKRDIAISQMRAMAGWVKNNLDEAVDLDDRQLKLVKTIAKQSLISVIMSIGGLLAIFSTLMVYLITLDGDNTAGRYVYEALYVISFATVPVILAGCVWLSFSFAKKDYKRYCHFFHKCWFNMYQKIVIARIERAAKKQTEKNKKQLQLGVNNNNNNGNQPDDVYHIMMDDPAEDDASVRSNSTSTSKTSGLKALVAFGKHKDDKEKKPGIDASPPPKIATIGSANDLDFD